MSGYFSKYSNKIANSDVYESNIYSTNENYFHCKNALCLVQALPKKFEKVFVIFSNESNYTMDSMGKTKECFRNIQELSIETHKVKVYEFLEDQCYK